MLQPVCLDRAPIGNPSELAFMPVSTPSKKVLEPVVTTGCTVVPAVREVTEGLRGDAHDTADQDRGGAGGPGAGSAMDHAARGPGNRSLTSHPANVRPTACPDRG